MRFTTRRGRPKSEKSDKIDRGTIQLQQKVGAGHTKEAIDICYDREIINQPEYRAALHFRWLYTVRFGAPDVSAVDLDGYMGKDVSQYTDDFWHEQREKEYAMATERLRSDGALKIIMNVVIFNYFPRFLTGINATSPSQVAQNEKEIIKLSEGLAELAELWGFSCPKGHFIGGGEKVMA